jgi:transposase
VTYGPRVHGSQVDAARFARAVQEGLSIATLAERFGLSYFVAQRRRQAVLRGAD